MLDELVCATCPDDLQNLKTYEFFYWFAWPALRPSWSPGVRVERVEGVRDARALGARVAELEAHWARLVHAHSRGSTPASTSTSSSPPPSPLFCVTLVPRTASASSSSSSSASTTSSPLTVVSLAECRAMNRESLAQYEVRMFSKSTSLHYL